MRLAGIWTYCLLKLENALAQGGGRAGLFAFIFKYGDLGLAYLRGLASALKLQVRRIRLPRFARGHNDARFTK